MTIGEETEIPEDVDDSLEEEQEFARQTLALLKSGRILSEEENLSCVLFNFAFYVYIKFRYQ